MNGCGSGGGVRKGITAQGDHRGPTDSRARQVAKANSRLLSLHSTAA
ncbi:MAG: hypothetical protein ACF788_07050 [Novipirellula sp. JB048]